MSKHLENLAELNIGLLRDISVGAGSYSLIRDHIHSIVLLLGSDENTFVNLCDDIKEERRRKAMEEMMKLKMFLQLAKNTCEIQENKDVCERC